MQAGQAGGGDGLEIRAGVLVLQAHLLGHSMGGKTVMQFAGRYPERVDHLIVADMAPKAYPPHHREILESLSGVELEGVTSRQEVDAQLQNGIPQPTVRQFLLKSLHRRSDKSLAWKFNLPVIVRQYEQVIGNVQLSHPYEGPCLFLYGGKSNYLTEADKPMVQEWFPQAQFECLPEAGHWLHAEDPDAFIVAVNRFLPV